MQEAIELMRVVFRTVIQEAYEKGVMYGKLQTENAKLRATIATLDEKLANLKTENAALRGKVEKLRGAEITD